jgi:hypothetical protein
MTPPNEPTVRLLLLKARHTFGGPCRRPSTHATPVSPDSRAPQVSAHNNGTRVPTRQPRSVAAPGGPSRSPLGSPCGLAGPHGPGVAFRHPRSAICVPVRTSRSATHSPFHTDRSSWDFLFALPRPPGRRTTLLQHARRRSDRASWIYSPNGLPSRRRSLPRKVLDPNAPSWQRPRRIGMARPRGDKDITNNNRIALRGRASV